MLDAVIDSLPIAIFCKNATEDYRFVLWNKMQEEVTGIPRESALGATDYDLFPRSEADGFRAMDEHVVLTGATVDIPEEEVQTGTGDTIWLHTVKVQVEDPVLGKNLLLGMSEDVSERRKLNENLDQKNAELESTQLQLIQAEKMESIGRLAAGVAHEVKNPLALLLMGVEYLDGGVKPDDPNLPEIIKEMREAIHRADKIIRGLVDFSSSRKLNLARQDVRPILDQALLLVRHELLRAGACVKTRYQPDIPDVRLDAAKYEQVVVNLLINALHALKDTENPELEIAVWSAAAGAEDLDEGARS
ncbi:MAG: PAS domain-containing protein, partial [Verrucomicrobiota bacterium]